jgi:penicillin-binding protein 1A
VLEREDAAILTMMLRNAVQHGTGKALTLKEVTDVAGKTGTSGKNCDKWFVGYTPELLCGVWYGYEYPASLTDTKGNPALQIFDSVMQEILRVRPGKIQQFETPSEVVAVRYCRDSGMLPCEACMHDPRGERTVIGYFKKGTEPKERCNRHVCVRYCEHGGIASADCDAKGCRTVSLVRVQREFPRQIHVQDAPYTYVLDPLTIERNLNRNEPYYANIYNSNANYGIGIGETPFNHSCPVHESEDFWQRRTEIA